MEAVGEDNDNNINNIEIKEVFESSMGTGATLEVVEDNDIDNTVRLQDTSAPVHAKFEVDLDQDKGDDDLDDYDAPTTSSRTQAHAPKIPVTSSSQPLTRLPVGAYKTDTDPVDSQAFPIAEGIEIEAAATNNNSNNNSNSSIKYNSNSSFKTNNHSSWTSSEGGSMMMEPGFEDEHDLDDDNDVIDDGLQLGKPQKAMNRVRDSFQRRQKTRLNKASPQQQPHEEQQHEEEEEEAQEIQQQQQQQSPQRHRSRQREVSNISNITTQSYDEDTVTGNWSIDEGDSSGDEGEGRGERGKRRGKRGERRRQISSLPQTVEGTESFDSSANSESGVDESGANNQHQHKQVQQLLLSREDIEICQRLDLAYDRALEERQVGYTARYNSVRQSACFAVGFCILYLTLGTFFFMRQAGWDVADSLLFSIYTITTVGYGQLENPETPLFQLYTIFFIFIGSK
jgi:hypothetical protein